MRNFTLLAAVAAAALPLAASAYTHGKPGLWQITAQMKFNSGGPKIPPEQIEKMKQMGIKIPGQDPIVTKICVTPEQAAKDTPPPPDPKHECQMENFKRDGKTFSGDTVCNGEMKGKGHFTVTYDSDTHYSGSMQFAGASPHGPVDMNNQFSGDWQSDDCGTVKSLPMSKN